MYFYIWVTDMAVSPDNYQALWGARMSRGSKFWGTPTTFPVSIKQHA